MTKRKTKRFGYARRNYRFVTNILKGNVLGETENGRTRGKVVEDLKRIVWAAEVIKK